MVSEDSPANSNKSAASKKNKEKSVGEKVVKVTTVDSLSDEKQLKVRQGWAKRVDIIDF